MLLPNRPTLRLFRLTLWLPTALSVALSGFRGSISLGPHYNPKLMLFSPRWRHTWGVLYSVPRSESGCPQGTSFCPSHPRSPTGASQDCSLNELPVSNPGFRVCFWEVPLKTIVVAELKNIWVGGVIHRNYSQTFPKQENLIVPPHSGTLANPANFSWVHSLFFFF